MIYEEHNFTLKGATWKAFTAIQKDNPGAIETSKGLCYLEKIGDEFRTRYWVSTYRPTMQGSFHIQIQKDVEDLTVPKMLIQGEALPTFSVRPELGQQLFNLPTGANSYVEQAGKFLIRSLCETAIGDSIKHDIVPYILDMQTFDFNPVQPHVFSVETREGGFDVTTHDTNGQAEYSIDGENWQVETVFNVGAGEHTLYAKDESGNIVTQEVSV